MVPVLFKNLGVTDYQAVFAAMQAFTEERNHDTIDEVWFTQHQPVFTQGQAGKAEHVLAPGDIPVVQTDRGGQVTYHGPGQITAYLLFDIRRRKLGVRDLVTGIEMSMVDTLAEYGISAQPRPDAPGVYIEGNKIGSLGLRVRRGCSYHGLSLNVDMDLEPFSRINPCGLTGVAVTHMAQFTAASLEQVQARLEQSIVSQFNLRRVADSPHAA